MSVRPVRWSEVTALFGGAFDPPHVGHRIAVQGLLKHPGVRAVRVLPSPNPAYKPTAATAEHRIEMAKLAFSGLAEIDPCEIRRAQAKPGSPTYSYDTLIELGGKLPELAFVIGTDQLQKLPSWHRFPEVLGLCHWIVLNRKGQDESWRKTLSDWQASGLTRLEGDGFRVQSSRKSAGAFLQVFPTDAPLLSSTQIRESLARSGNPPTGSISPEVGAYLMKHRLYGTGKK